MNLRVGEIIVATAIACIPLDHHESTVNAVLGLCMPVYSSTFSPIGAPMTLPPAGDRGADEQEISDGVASAARSEVHVRFCGARLDNASSTKIAEQTSATAGLGKGHFWYTTD